MGTVIRCRKEVVIFRVLLSVLFLSIFYPDCLLKQINAEQSMGIVTAQKELLGQKPVWTEKVSQRNSNDRVWEITKWQEEINPVTNEPNIIHVKSYVREKGCGICYKDSNDSWQITDTSWKQTATGFIMNKASYVLEMGKTANSQLNYEIDGETFVLKADSIKIYDGENILPFVSVGVVNGYIDPNDKSKLIYPNAFCEGIDLEIQAQPDGFHQNVVFKNKLDLPAGLQKEKAKVFLYTELSLDSYLDNSKRKDYAVKMSIGGSSEIYENNIPNLSVNRFSKSKIDFIIEKEGVKTSVRHSFVDSKVLQHGKSDKLKNLATADKQVIYDNNKTYLVESLDCSKMDEAVYPVVWDYHNVSETIDSDETWYADATYYISGVITLGNGVELKIEPGTIIKVGIDYEYGDGYINAVSGKIIAKGEPYDYIIFTSVYDSNMGEIISTAYQPSLCDWYGVCANVNSVFEFCKFAYSDMGVSIMWNSTEEPFPIRNNIFTRSAAGICVRVESNNCSGTLKIFNNLVLDCSAYGVGIFKGRYVTNAPNADIEIINNTIENIYGDTGDGIGISRCEDFGGEVAIKNNLITNCNRFGIENYGGTSNLNVSYNALYGCYINYYGLSGGNDLLLSVSPYNTQLTYLGSCFLNNDSGGGAELINAGYGNANNYYSTPQNWSVHHVSGARLFTSTTQLSTDTTWQPLNDYDTGVVDIGYHHPRVDYLTVPTVNVDLSGYTLTINPGTVIAIGGGLGIQNGKIISNGTPSNGGRIKYMNYALASAGWAGVKYRSAYGGCIWPADSDSEFSFCDFTALRDGIISETVFNYPPHDNIFNRNWIGLQSNAAQNCLFIGNYFGMHHHSDYEHPNNLNVINCDFDRNAYGLYCALGWPNVNYHIKNCIFSNNGEGIRAYNSEPEVPPLIENNNAFYLNGNHKIFSYGTYSAYNVMGASDYTASPYISGTTEISSDDFFQENEWENFVDRFYLPQDSALIDSGTMEGSMCGYTTDFINATIDNNRRDIGYHYPTSGYEQFWLGTCSNKPTAKLSIIPNNVIPNGDELPAYVIKDKEVLLDASMSEATSYPVIKYQWDFDGDGNYDYAEGGVVHPDGTADGRTWHSFTFSSGLSATIPVTLMVTDSVGNSDTVTINVIVSNDSDSDGLPDQWEKDNFNDNINTTNGSGNADSPDDGSSDLCEYLHGSNPISSTSSPQAGIIAVSPLGSVTIQKAINESIANDTIIVLPGTYNENIDFSKPDRTLCGIDPDNWELVARTIIKATDTSSPTVHIDDSESTISNTTILEGLTITGGWGGIKCEDASPIISNCLIWKNKKQSCYSGCPADLNGGGISLSGSDNAIIRNCFIVFNEVEDVFGNDDLPHGGGIYNGGNSSLQVSNSVLYGNRSIAGEDSEGYGSGLYNESDSALTLINCTVAKNCKYDSYYYGSGLYNNGYINLYGTIFWENYLKSNGTLNPYNCNLKQYDPVFADIDIPAGKDGIYGTRDDGLRLRTNSSCIDTGYDTVAIPAPSQDIIGQPRVDVPITSDSSNNLNHVDIGAYELNKIWYAKPSATGSGNGQSWENACTLQTALDDSHAASTPFSEIWVAADTYTPGTSRNDSFELAENVSVYGRFAGTETDFADRNMKSNQTIISGDITGYDSYHVVKGAADALLDGFVVQYGLADGSGNNGYGGGIYSDESIVVRNCFITDSTACHGGGIYISSDSSSMQVVNCVLANNSSSTGGAIFNTGNLSEIVNCTIAYNTADNFGGGIENIGTMLIENSIIWDNYPDSIYNYNSAVPMISNSDIQGCGGSGEENWDETFGNDCGGSKDESPLFALDDEVGIAGEDGILGTDDDGLKLPVDSPCVDTGNNSFIHEGLDISGDKRIRCYIVDMGTYEHDTKAVLSGGVTISGGEEHTMMVFENGRALTCGDNVFSQLGRDGDENILQFVLSGEMNTQSELLEGIADVAAGWKHSIFLTGDGQVLTCGNDENGCLGDGGEQNAVSSIPVWVHAGEQNLSNPGANLSNIIFIAAGRSGTHSLAVEDATGFVFAWGNNGGGQLGKGDNAESSYSSPIKVLGGQMGTFYLQNITFVSCGAYHSMSLASDGFVYCFGNNETGQLGINSTDLQRTTPVKVLGTGGSGNLANICTVSAGWWHSMALERIETGNPNCKGRVYCWGEGDYGQLGDGYMENRPFPVLVLKGEQNSSSVNLENIIAIGAGCDHSIALEADGHVLCWGSNFYGQLGNHDYEYGSETPVYVKLHDGSRLSNIVKISAGYWHNLAVDSSGNLYVWGSDNSGKLGLGGSGNQDYAVPVQFDW